MNQNLKNRLQLAAFYGAFGMAIVLIQHFEGAKHKPYYDVGGVLTVCYGHTGDDIDKNKIYSESECKAFLDKDLKKVKKRIDPVITVPIPELTRAALYSFTYNVGVGAFIKSTLLKLLNAGHKNEACDQLRRWINVHEKPWKGLMTRREVEEIVCKTDNVDSLEITK